ncbi:MAG: hypothetical protein MJ252_27845, partial [archaeon]|nr:hypothetical protein [archaeon]
LLNNATEAVIKNERPEVYSLLISKTAKYFGLSKTRNIFSKAMDNLEGDQIAEIGVKFANIECKLGEIERARTIYKHISQFCDPEKDENKMEFWDKWEKFELEQGTAETFQDMESIKRNVQSKFSLNVPIFNSSGAGAVIINK